MRTSVGSRTMSDKAEAAARGLALAWTYYNLNQIFPFVHWSWRKKEWKTCKYRLWRRTIHTF